MASLLDLFPVNGISNQIHHTNGNDSTNYHADQGRQRIGQAVVNG
ncbi:hypothetical protein [Larkinella soli]|nr:hypothetical protein [Larkinella soli]